MKTTICVVRHGQTDWNFKKLIQGRLNNPLNDTGRSQVKQTGLVLKEHDPHWDLIISSPLDRAYESGKIIAKEIGYDKEIIIDNEVIEREFGSAEGQNITPEIYQRIIKDDVEGLEKSHDLQNRAYNAIINIAKKYPGKKVLITSHSHFIKGLFTKLSNEFTFLSMLDNASLNYVIVENDKVIDFTFNKHF